MPCQILRKIYTCGIYNSRDQSTKGPSFNASSPPIPFHRVSRDPDWLVEDEGERVVGHLAKSSKAIQINARMTAMLKRIVGTSTSKQRPMKSWCCTKAMVKVLSFTTPTGDTRRMWIASCDTDVRILAALLATYFIR